MIPLPARMCLTMPGPCDRHDKQTGTAKGFVLTAWRLLRCQPLGAYFADLAALLFAIVAVAGAITQLLPAAASAASYSSLATLPIDGADTQQQQI